MNFLNQKPSNTVEYYLYPSIDVLKTNVKQQLDDLVHKYYECLKPYLKNYIWHNETFNLKTNINHSGTYIYGKCNYEDNVEDEWFIVFLLKILTEFDQKLFIRVNDEDGEFLLIESALCLEKWAQEPRHTENRVFLFNGELHLVSPKFIKSKSNCNLNRLTKDCMDFILKNPDKTRCNNSIQNCINERIGNYPDNVNRLHHNAHCHLPISIAAILYENPDLISTAVRAFYYRTPDDVKFINSLEHFKLDKWITTNVKFNRCSFAQLSSQEFNYDFKIFTIPSKNSKEYNLFCNGVKITAGFEIMVQNFEKHKSILDAEYSETFEKQIIQAGKRVYDRLKTLDRTRTDFIPNPLPPPDDESWLHIDAEQLETLLNHKFNSFQKDKNDKSYAKDIPDTLMKFIGNQNAGLNGAEFSEPDFKSKEFMEFMNKIESSDDDCDIDSSIDDEFDSEDLDEIEEDEENGSTIPEMKDIMKQMDSELAKTILSKSFEKAPIDSDDSDDESSIKFNALSNIVQSVQEEMETSNGVGPATTLFAFMNQRLPNIQRKE